MGPETFVLGLISGLRPATSQAAVVALLETPDPRRRLLFFLVAGFATSMVFGLVIVLVMHGATVGLGGTTFTALFNLVAGVAALAFAMGYRQGRITVRRRERRATTARTATTRIAQRLRNPSVATAAVVGVVTHLPGLIYLVALNGIAGVDPGVGTAVLAVFVYQFKRNW